ncbi:MAG: glucokinase [Bacteroidetes bacterium]|nr:glucokinase [Bacteroidota bacterium]
MRNSLIPIAFPNYEMPIDGTTILAADIGGTKTDMAFFRVNNGEPHLVKEFRYPSKSWNSLVDIARDFNPDKAVPDRFCISFAGPVRNGKALGTNLHWNVDSKAISVEMGVPHVYLLNDLEANCYGLAALKAEDLRMIYPGKNHDDGNAAVISPGTGLGEGGLYWDGTAYRPFATEGGHTHFAARTELDWELFLHLSKKYGHVSWERVVSGIGIAEIFGFLKEVKGWKTSEALDEALKTNDTAAAIGKASQTGCAVSVETLRLFMRYLAAEAANIALKLKATGGLYIGGGILPKIWNEEHYAIFNEYFFAVGRLTPLVEAVPVYMILNQKTALWGAGYYGAYVAK